jgi:hypothetical protein
MKTVEMYEATGPLSEYAERAVTETDSREALRQANARSG